MKSLEQKPVIKGKATKLREAISITEYVKGRNAIKAPYFLKSWLSDTACITAPAPKNKSAL